MTDQHVTRRAAFVALTLGLLAKVWPMGAAEAAGQSVISGPTNDFFRIAPQELDVSINIPLRIIVDGETFTITPKEFAEALRPR